MTEVERYKKLKVELEDVAGKLGGIPGRIGQLTAETAADRDEGIRAEYLGDEALATRKRAGIRSSEQELQRLKAEEEDLRRRRGVLVGVLEETRRKAEAELAPVYVREFAKTVKALVAALRTAHRAELESGKAVEKARRAFDEIDSSLSPLPSWSPLVMKSLGEPARMQPEFEAFLAKMKDAEIDLG